MIRTIIFDMDGVIVDSEPTHQKMECEMFEELGLVISAKEHKDYIGTSSMDMWTKISRRHYLEKTPEQLLLYGRKKYWEALDNDRVPLVEGVLSLIAKLHTSKYNLQVASSATRPTVDKVLAHFNLGAFFNYRIGGNEVSLSKPNPEIFIKAAKLSGTKPSECLVIEDSANGVKAAKSAGMFCIAYANPGTGSQDLSYADAVISHLLEIDLQMIQNLAG